MQTIPLSASGARRVTVPLGEDIGTYIFRTYWNYHNSMWYLDLFDENEQPLALGLALVPDIDLLRAYPLLSKTIGQLRISDSSYPKDGNTGTDTLGNTAQLVHFRPGAFEKSFPALRKIPALPIFDLKDIIHE